MTKIHPSLAALAVPINSIREDPQNARSHDRASVTAIAASLTRFGQRAPLVVLRGAGVILSGNGRYKAACSLGWDSIAVVHVDDDSTTARAYALADNRTAELSQWDDELLALAIRDVGQRDPLLARSLGWSESELDDLVSQINLPVVLDPPEEFNSVTFNSDQWSEVKLAMEYCRSVLVDGASDSETLAAICAHWHRSLTEK